MGTASNSTIPAAAGMGTGSLPPDCVQDTNGKNEKNGKNGKSGTSSVPAAGEDVYNNDALALGGSRGDIEYVDLLPSDIALEPFFDVRPFKGSQAALQDKLERMAHDLMERGQDEDVKVTRRRKNGSLLAEYVMVVGHRRRAAALLANEWLTASHKPLIHLHCVVLVGNRAELLQTAIRTNENREDNTAINRAELIKRLRAEYPKWKTQTLADFLGVSCATVTQSDVLLDKLSPKAQEYLHDGVISVDDALKQIVKVEKARQAEVIEKALMYETAAARTPGAPKAAKEKKTADSVGPTIVYKDGLAANWAVVAGKEDPAPFVPDFEDPEPPEKSSPEPQTVEDNAPKAKAKAKASSASIRKAIEKTPDASTDLVSRNKKILLDFWDTISGSPVYGPEDSAIRVFAGYFVSDYATGKDKTGKKTLNLFDKMVAGALKPEKAEKAVKEPKTPKVEKSAKPSKSSKGAKPSKPTGSPKSPELPKPSKSPKPTGEYKPVDPKRSKRSAPPVHSSPPPIP